MIRLGIVFGLLGLLVATVLVLREGAGEVLGLLAVAGWGLVGVSLTRFVPLLLSAVSWQVLLPGRAGRLDARSVAHFTWVVWVREAVNALLPVLRIGGEVVSIRLLNRYGVRAAPAVASLVVDITLSLFILIAFVSAGVLLLLQRTGDESMIAEMVVGLGISAVVVALFVVVQRIGLFGLSARLLHAVGGDRWAHLAGGTARVDRAVRRMWRLRRRVIASTLWQLASWLAGVGEMWLAMWVLGLDPSWTDAFILEALIQGVGQIAFAVPGAVGVQEGGFLVIGTLLGLSPEAALALALARRARDLIVYAPGLLAWQALEGHWLLRRGRARRETEAVPPV